MMELMAFCSSVISYEVKAEDVLFCKQSKQTNHLSNICVFPGAILF